ncbi:MAG: N-acetylmuramoyl-L-alanine amidase family protein [Prevotella sp.]
MLFMSCPQLFAAGQFTLVIDAGHGGHDHGAPGAISEEKNLTLKYALAFGKLVEANCPDVKVVYTRKTDVFIPLHQRADIANNAKANLFISIHINALDGIHTAHGFQSYTLGRGEHTGDKGIRQNLEVAKRENSVIFLEKDYKKIYKGLDMNSAEGDIMFEFIADKNRERSVQLSRLMQQEVCAATGRQNGGAHQNNLAVLRLTSMPAILLELGFISTPDEEQFLNSDQALEAYTKGIYNAFIKYKNKYDDNINVPYRTSSSDRSGEVLPVSPPKNNVSSSVNLQKKDSGNLEKNEENSATRYRKENNRTKSKNKSRQNRNDVSSSRKVTSSERIDNSRPVFKIQIFVSSQVLKDGDPRLKGLENCENYKEGNFRKYTYGASNNYNEIYRLRKQILDKFPQAFIIAFKNGKKMDVNEAIREFKSNR